MEDICNGAQALEKIHRNKHTIFMSNLISDMTYCVNEYSLMRSYIVLFLLE